MKTYLVGGAVRDRLLNQPVYDRDWVVVGATAEQMSALGYQAVGKDFPVFLHPRSKEEYALARTERKNGHGYKGFDFYASPDVSLEQDLQRRDLTINAMAEDERGQVIDPFGGQRDLAERRLRHVSPAFAEDPLRVLRVARFAARFSHLGFQVAAETLRLMAQIADSGELQHLTRERVWSELERALQERSPGVFFELLRQCRALAVLLPEIDQLLASADGPAALAALQRSTAYPTLAATRLAILCLFIDGGRERLEPMLVRLKAPNDTRALCLLVSAQARTLLAVETLNPEQQLTLYENLDLQRRPERLPQLLLACRAVAAVEPGAELAAEQQLQQLCRAVETIEPRQLTAEGFKGKALGNELRRRRLLAIHALERQ